MIGLTTSTVPSHTPKKSLDSSTLHYPIRKIQISAAPFSTLRSKTSLGSIQKVPGAGGPQAEWGFAVPDKGKEAQLIYSLAVGNILLIPVLLAVFKPSSVQLLSVVLLSQNLPINGEKKLICIHSMAWVTYDDPTGLFLHRRASWWFQQTTVLISLHINIQIPKNLSAWAPWIK